MATLFDENRFEAEIDSKVKTTVKNELPKESVHRATVLRRDSSGTWWVRLDSGDETPVLVNKVDMSVGDVVTVTLRDHVTYADGNITSPPMSAYNATNYVDDVVAKNVKAVTADIGYLKADVATIGYAQIEDADITNARIQNLVYEVTQNITHLQASDARILELEANSLTANSAVITDLQAETAKIENLEAEDLSAAVGYIGELTAGSIDAEDIISDHADISNLDANYAHITNGVIDNAKIGYADVEDLDANYAHVTNGVIDTATIGYANVNGLDANYAHVTNGVIDTATIGYANVNGLDANYAHIDLANVNNAWITNGVIADAAISDAQIIGVSANKLTAGTIDADTIHVTNLSTDNLKVKKINGQPILGGYSAVSNKISGYSSKNPVIEGWYELNAGNFVLSQDTAVSPSKVYYSQTDSVNLYDQETIDGMVDDLNARIDAQIETWTEDHVPTLNNSPASSWTTNDLKAEHVGDICYVLNAGEDYDGYTYRFAYDQSQSQYKWVLIKDNQVTAALGRISDLETFESTTSSWIEETDEGLETIRENHTTLSGRVDKVVKSSTQLWYTKANSTAPSAPTSKVTSTSTSGNAWRTVVPTYSASYPYYFYCWQYVYEDGTCGWSAVIYDQATTESEERARTGVANAATADGKAVTAQNTANTNIKSSIQLWFTKANTTAPSKPSSQVTTSNASTGNAWNLVVPTYSSSYPYYFYCYQQQKGDGAYQWTDVVYDEATSTAMKKAQEALPASTYNTFVQTTFKAVVDTVDEQSTTITQLTETAQYGGMNVFEGSSDQWTSLELTGGTNQCINIVPAANAISFPDLGASANDVYTVSFDIKFASGTTAGTNQSFQGSVNLGGSWTGVTFASESTNLSSQIAAVHSSGGEARLHTSIKVTSAMVDGTLSGVSYFNVRFDGWNGTVYVKCCKVERGSIATPWEYSQGDMTTISNTVNSVKSTATTNSSTISQLTTTLGTNEDGTTAANDVVHRVTTTETNLNGITTRVSATEAQIKGQFATSSTGASTAAKTATITPTNSSWTRATGSTVTVKFTTANTASSPTLNINSTGAASIRNYAGSALTEAEYKWPAGAAMTFTFDGTYWRIQDSTELTRLSSAESSITQNADKISMVVDGSSTSSSLVLTDKAINAITNQFEVTDSTGTSTIISGGKIQANSLTIGSIDMNDSATTAAIANSSLATDISNAAATATNYITADSSGIKLHDAGDTSNYAHITSSGTEVYKGGTSVAGFGETARIGAANSSRFIMDEDELAAYDSDGNQYFNVSEDRLVYGGRTAANTDDLAGVSFQVKKIIDGLQSSNYTTFTQTGDTFSFEFTKLNNALGAIESYVHIQDDVMTLGSTDKPVCAQLSSDGLVFYPIIDVEGEREIDKQNPIASLVIEGSGDSAQGVLVIHRAVVVNELRFGDWAWTPRPGTGNLSLKWIGA